MMNRILLSLLSVGMAAGTVYGCQQDTNGKPPYFHFFRGISDDPALNARFSPFFGISLGYANLYINPNRAERIAFVHSLKEIQTRSRAGAKEGLLCGLLGGVFGAVTGAVIGTIAGSLTRTSQENPFIPDERQQKKMHKLFKGVVGAALGATLGGLGLAAFYTPALAEEGVRVCVPNACYERSLQEFCQNAHDYAYRQLSEFPGITPELAATLEKAKNNQALSAEETEQLNAHVIRFTSMDLDIYDRAPSCYIKDTPLTQVTTVLNETNTRHQAHLPSIVAGGQRAQQYARQNKWRTVFAVRQDDYERGEIFDELKEQELRVHMQQTYETLSSTHTDENNATPVAEQLAARVAEITKAWK